MISRIRPWRFAFAFAALATALSSGCAKKTYLLNLSPPYHAGQKFGLVADSSQHTHVEATLTAKGAATAETKTQNSEAATHLEGDGEVLAVFLNGNVQKISLVLKTLSAMKEGQPIPGLPAVGAKIIVEWSDMGRTMEINGQPPSTDLARTMGDVLNLGDLFGFSKSSQTDQDTFGPAQPVAVGATWPVNSEAMSKALQAALESEVSGVNGTMRLDSVTGEGDERVIAVSGSLSPKGVKPKMSPEVVVDSVSLEGEISERVPTTTTKGKLQQAAAIRLKIIGRADNEAVKIKLSLNSEVKNSRTVTFH